MAIKSVLLSLMFLNTLFEKKKVLMLGSIFLGGGGGSHLIRQRKFYAAFFANCGNLTRLRSRINPGYMFTMCNMFYA